VTKDDACWYIADSFSLWVERLVHPSMNAGMMTTFHNGDGTSISEAQFDDDFHGGKANEEYSQQAVKNTSQLILTGIFLPYPIRLSSVKDIVLPSAVFSLCSLGFFRFWKFLNYTQYQSIYSRYMFVRKSGGWCIGINFANIIKKCIEIGIMAAFRINGKYVIQ